MFSMMIFWVVVKLISCTPKRKFNN